MEREAASVTLRSSSECSECDGLESRALRQTAVTSRVCVRDGPPIAVARSSLDQLASTRRGEQWSEAHARAQERVGAHRDKQGTSAGQRGSEEQSCDGRVAAFRDGTRGFCEGKACRRQRRDHTAALQSDDSAGCSIDVCSL